MIRRSLAREGWDVVTAHNGSEGLALARQMRPMVIVLDVLMPELDGWSVLQVLQADPHLADVPVVMTTFLEEENKAYALGAAHYLAKPVDQDQLRRIVARYGDRPVRTVLVVDDDENCRSLARRNLGDDGWRVIEAEDGRAGLARARMEHPDLVLLDLMMPHVDGFEFLAQLQADPDLRNIPVVAITAADLTKEDHERLNGGVLKVLRKAGVRADEISGELRRLLAARTPASRDAA
jgi:CheY-like chemotaxis protein